MNLWELFITGQKKESPGYTEYLLTVMHETACLVCIMLVPRFSNYAITSWRQKSELLSNLIKSYTICEPAMCIAQFQIKFGHGHSICRNRGMCRKWPMQSFWELFAVGLYTDIYQHKIFALCLLQNTKKCHEILIFTSRLLGVRRHADKVRYESRTNRAVLRHC